MTGPATRVRNTIVAAVVAAAALAGACGPPPQPPQVAPNPLSLGHGDVYGNQAASGASISADGNWTAFASAADNLVPGDTNGAIDVFVRNRLTGSVTRVREHSGPTPRISADGRYVSYTAAGSVVGVHDRATGTHVEWTTTLSFAVTPVVTDDGSAAVYGAYSSFGIFAPGCRVRDLGTGVESDCPHGGPGYGSVAYETVSANARFVLYYWLDQNGGGTSNRLLWDRALGTTTVVTAPVASFGGAPAVSDDGRFIASVHLLPGEPIGAAVHDLQLGTVTTLADAPDGNTAAVDISADGRRVLLLSEATNLVAGDTNGAPDLFLWDTATHTVTRVSQTLPDGAQLPGGALRCGAGPGQLLADGTAACILSGDAVLAADANGVADAYLAP